MTYLPTQPGASWKVNAGGVEGGFWLRLDASGVIVTGEIFGDPINGIWQEGAAKLTFTRGSGPNAQFYTGYLSPRVSRPTEGKYYLAGTFDDATGTYGWFAEGIALF